MTETIWTGRSVPAPPMVIDAADVECFIDTMQDKAVEVVGKVGYEWPVSTPAQMEDLRQRLDAAFQAWLVEHKLLPKWFSVVDVQKHPDPAAVPEQTNA